MPLKFTTTDKIGVTHGVKALVYGAAGAGKTTLCATAPAPIILSAEAGLLSIRHMSIPVIQIETRADVREALQWLQESDEARQFQTVCLDSISEIAEQVLSAEKELTRDPRRAYGALLDEMIPLVKGFRDLPGKHVLVTSKMEQTKDDFSGVITCRPSMPGSKLGPELPYLFDEVFYLGIGQTDDGQTYRYLLTQPDGAHEAKDRSGALDPMEKPDFSNIIQKIMKGANNG